MTQHPPIAAVIAASGLPIIDVIDQVTTALATQRRAVVVAPPGAGKTTIVPLALLSLPALVADGDQRIVMLEPRRLATRAAARRMSSLIGDEIGGLIGYQTRDERRIGAHTRIEVVTEGILTRRLQRDPSLPGTAVVIFDEVHERNLPTDLGLALTLDTATHLRPDLAILAMSATPETDALARLLTPPATTDETPPAPTPVIVSDGRTHRVDIIWAPPGQTERGQHARSQRQRGQRQRLETAAVATIQRALRDNTGDILVFLPGIGEIRRCADLLASGTASDVDIMPLAGALTPGEQDAALAPAAPGHRKVVLATDIAETSLTVPGVRVVIDSGLVRAPRHDPATDLTRLTTITASRASADQRAGRAGRLEAGVCYRLWSKLEHTSRPRHREAEITSVDLSGLLLELSAWGTDPTELAFIDPPPARPLAAARTLLVELGALDDDGTPLGRLTDIGRRMLELPVHPRLARMIIAEPDTLACVVAAVIDERDIMRRTDDTPADLAVRVRVVCGLDAHDLADRRAAARVRERAADIARRAGIAFDPHGIDADATGRILLEGFGDRLAGRRRPGQFQLLGGSGAWLPDTDPLATEAFVVAADLDGRRDRARIRLAAGVDADEIATRFADRLAITTQIEWDTTRDDLVEHRERRLGAIMLGTATTRAAPGPATTAALSARVAATGLAQLDWNASARSLRARVEYLHRELGEPWPDWSIEALVADLDTWLAPALVGATCRADLEAIDPGRILRARLPHDLARRLDDLAPARMRCASGREIDIDYRDGVPAAAVRVQELYGTTDHPTAAGRPVVLTLLSPADRPIQITADLPGFWDGSWAEVRREMAGRYPKHHWPVDGRARPGRDDADRDQTRGPR